MEHQTAAATHFTFTKNSVRPGAPLDVPRMGKFKGGTTEMNGDWGGGQVRQLCPAAAIAFCL